MKKAMILCLLAWVVLTSCGQKAAENSVIISRLDTKKAVEKKVPFKPYPNCTVSWKSSLWVGVDVQDCFIKGKKLSVVADEKLGAYYIGVDSGSGYIMQELAIQIFDVGVEWDEKQRLQKVLDTLKKSGNSDSYAKCSFVKDEKLSDAQKSVYTMIGDVKTDGTSTDCGDYDYKNKNHFRYFYIYPGKSKILFINQLKEKRLFDEKSVQVLN